MGNRAAGLSRRRKASGKLHGSPAVESRRFKVLIMGASGVGKTTLFRRLLDQPQPPEYEPSTAVEIGAKLIQLEGNSPVLAELWDVPHRVYAGKDIFETYLKGVDGVLLVYDITSPASWKAVVDYHKLVSENVHTHVPVTVSVVGNKVDTARKPIEEAEAVVEAKKWIAVHDSAKGIQHRLVSVTGQRPTFEILRSSVNSMLMAQTT